MMNQDDKRPSQMRFSSKIFVRIHTYTHRTDCPTQTTRVVGNKIELSFAMTVKFGKTMFWSVNWCNKSQTNELRVVFRPKCSCTVKPIIRIFSIMAALCTKPNSFLPDQHVVRIQFPKRTRTMK